MAQKYYPYLCGGTFLAQILRARKKLSTPTDYMQCKKEALSEQETLKRLISIYHLSDFHGGPSLKTYTSKFKKCSETIEVFAEFSDHDMNSAFTSDILKADSIALKMMQEFVVDFIDPEKELQLVRCLLDLILSDKSINESDKIFIRKGNTPIKKSELREIFHFNFEHFLLGVWHYIIINRAKYNELGADTYNEWYPETSRNSYQGKIGINIREEITIEHTITEELIPVVQVDEIEDDKWKKQDNHYKEKNSDSSKPYIQNIERATIINQNGDKNIHIDHIDTLNL